MDIRWCKHPALLHHINFNWDKSLAGSPNGEQKRRSSINWSMRCSFSILWNVIECAPLYGGRKKVEIKVKTLIWFDTGLSSAIAPIFLYTKDLFPSFRSIFFLLFVHFYRPEKWVKITPKRNKQEETKSMNGKYPINGNAFWTRIKNECSDNFHSNVEFVMSCGNSR